MYGMNGFYSGENPEEAFLSLKSLLPSFRGKKKMQNERTFLCHVSRYVIFPIFFSRPLRKTVSKVLFNWKKKLPNNYRFIPYKVCGFWKTQQQQNIPYFATTLVNHKEFLEGLVLCNKK